MEKRTLDENFSVVVLNAIDPVDVSPHPFT